MCLMVDWLRRERSAATQRGASIYPGVRRGAHWLSGGQHLAIPHCSTRNGLSCRRCHLADDVRALIKTPGVARAGPTKTKIYAIEWGRDERHVRAPMKQYVLACKAHECRVKRCKTRPNALTQRILPCSDTCLAMARCVRRFAPAHAGASCLDASEGLIDGPDRSNPKSVFSELAEG
jgi:hypothetical protein